MWMKVFLKIKKRKRKLRMFSSNRVNKTNITRKIIATIRKIIIVKLKEIGIEMEIKFISDERCRQLLEENDNKNEIEK